MIAKIKKPGTIITKRMEAEGEIMEVFLRDNLLRPDESVIEICFRGESGSGIIQLTQKELDTLEETIKKFKVKTKIFKFSE